MAAFKYNKLPFFDGVKIWNLKINHLSNFLLLKLIDAGKTVLPVLDGTGRTYDYKIPEKDLAIMKKIAVQRKLINE